MRVGKAIKQLPPLGVCHNPLEITRRVGIRRPNRVVEVFYVATESSALEFVVRDGVENEDIGLAIGLVGVLSRYSPTRLDRLPRVAGVLIGGEALDQRMVAV